MIAEKSDYFRCLYFMRGFGFVRNHEPSLIDGQATISSIRTQKYNVAYVQAYGFVNIKFFFH